ncbi:hypothetical protein Neosp_013951 [[Neocosmospora] mangrovei]
MDPFSALTIAVSTIQVVDFSANIFKDAYHVYKRGSVESSDGLLSASVDLRGLTKGLRADLQSNSLVADLADDERVSYVGASSDAATNEVIRNELILRIIVSLKLERKLDKASEDERFKALDSRTRQVAERLLDNRNFFTTGISEAETAVLNKLDEQEANTRKLHEETIAAVGTLHDWLSDKNQETKALFQSLSLQLTPSHLADLRQIQNEVLNFLWFRDIRSRAHALESPYGHTFSWIFDHDKFEDKRWDDLTAWLQGENGYYWISGKAGSGKSTLMKYVSSHPRTKTCLEAWASDEPLFIASFFFWYSGNPSLAELREALTLLATQQVMPLKICFFIDGVDEYDGDIAELANFLQGLSSQRTKLVCSSRPTAPCVFAFGHFPGLQLQTLTRQDIHNYVVENLLSNRQMAQLARQKTTHRLMNGLRNQDTADDLRKRLDELPSDIEDLYMHMLKRMEPVYRENASRFLQIMYQNSHSPNPLPMTTLRMAFADQYNLEAAIEANMGELEPSDIAVKCTDLQTRIRNCCCGLLEVRTQVAEGSVGSVVETREWNQWTHSKIDVGTYSLDFSDTHPSSPSTASTTSPLVDFGRLEEQTRFSDPDELSPTERTATHPEKANTDSESMFSDQTGEHPGDVWSQLTSTSPDGFDPWVSLAISCLTCIKTLPVEQDTLADQSEVWEHLVKALDYCFAAEASTDCSQDEIIEELDAAMDWHWRACKGWRPRYSLPEASHWSHLVPNEEGDNGWPHGGPAYDSMFALACRFGLKGYVKKVLDEDVALGQTALNRIVWDLSLDRTEPKLWKRQIEILKLSLERGADPNAPFHKGLSAWATTLGLCQPTNIITAEAWEEIIAALVEHKADLNAEVLDMSMLADNEMDTHDWLSPLWIIRERFSVSIASKVESRRIQKVSDRLQARILKLGGEYFKRELHRSEMIRRGVY